MENSPRRDFHEPDRSGGGDTVCGADADIDVCGAGEVNNRGRREEEQCHDPMRNFAG